MSISLAKGGNINLSKEAPGLKHVKICLGWDARTTEGAAFDLDAMVAVLDASGRMPADKDFVFFNNLVHPSGAIKHSGDNRTGDSAGDDEVIEINFERFPSDREKVTAVINIFDADTRRQNFGMVRNAYARVVDVDTNKEIVRFDLGEDFSTETCVVACEIYKYGSDWKFKAVGQGYRTGIDGFIADLGQQATH